MVTLEFKTLILRNGMKLDYKTQLAEIVRNVAPVDGQGAPKRGFLASDMDDTEPLAEKIEAANGKVELTAEEAVVLAGKMARAEWPFSDKAFRQFVADVEALKSQ
jgi:hypothetical protein